MSYILDALRKSEQQRRLSSDEVPTLATRHRVSRTASGSTAWWIGGGLFLLGGLASGVLFWQLGDGERKTPLQDNTTVEQRPKGEIGSVVQPIAVTGPKGLDKSLQSTDDPPSDETGRVVAGSTAAEPATVVAPPAMELPEPMARARGGKLSQKLRELSPPAQPSVPTKKADPDATVDRAASELISAASRGTPSPAVAAPAVASDPPASLPLQPKAANESDAAVVVNEHGGRQAEPVATAGPLARAEMIEAGESDQERYYDSLPLARHNSVPVTTISVHVFNPDPARRFLLGGMKRYREGDAMPDGVKLVSITRRGIVVEFQGKEYRHDVGSES